VNGADAAATEIAHAPIFRAPGRNTTRGSLFGQRAGSRVWRPGWKDAYEARTKWKAPAPAATASTRAREPASLESRENFFGDSRRTVH